MLPLSSGLMCLGAGIGSVIQPGYKEGVVRNINQEGTEKRKDKGQKKEPIRPLGRSGRGNGPYKGHIDLMSKVQIETVRKKGLFQGFEVFSGGKTDLCEKQTKWPIYAFLTIERIP
jgi:hypothetical protein